MSRRNIAFCVSLSGLGSVIPLIFMSGAAMAVQPAQEVLLAGSSAASERPLPPAPRAGAAVVPGASVTVSASLISDLIQDEREYSEPVSRVILGDRVTGCQTTRTVTRLQLLTDENGIRGELVSEGVVDSQTTTHNRRALVDSNGHHTFVVKKPVYFDGRQLLTKPAKGTVQASHQPTRVTTQASGVPLFGKAAERMAWSEVRRMAPEINQALAADLSQDVIPRVDREMEAGLVPLSRQLPGLLQTAADSLGVSADDFRACCDVRSIQLSVCPSTYSAHGRGVITEAAQLEAEEDVVVVISEEFLTHCVNQAVPAGSLIPDTQLQRLLTLDWQNLLAESWEQIPDRLHELQDEELRPQLFSLQIADTNPVQIRFADGAVTVQLLCKVIPRLGAAGDWLTVETRWTGQTTSDNLWGVMNTGVDVRPVALPVATSDQSLPPGMVAHKGTAGHEHESGISASSNALQTLSALRIPLGPLHVAYQSADESVTSEEPLPITLPGLLQASSPAPAGESVTDNPKTAASVTSPTISDTSAAAGAAWPALVKMAATQMIGNLPPLELPRTLPLRGSVDQPAGPLVRLHRIESQNGALRISLEVSP